MKISDIEIRLCRHQSGMTGGELRDGQGSELEFLVITMKTDEGLSGWGEASSTPRNGSLLTGFGVQQARGRGQTRTQLPKRSWECIPLDASWNLH